MKQSFFRGIALMLSMCLLHTTQTHASKAISAIGIASTAGTAAAFASCLKKYKAIPKDNSYSSTMAREKYKRLLWFWGTWCTVSAIASGLAIYNVMNPAKPLPKRYRAIGITKLDGYYHRLQTGYHYEGDDDEAFFREDGPGIRGRYIGNNQDPINEINAELRSLFQIAPAGSFPSEHQQAVCNQLLDVFRENNKSTGYDRWGRRTSGAKALIPPLVIHLFEDKQY